MNVNACEGKQGENQGLDRYLNTMNVWVGGGTEPTQLPKQFIVLISK